MVVLIHVVDTKTDYHAVKEALFTVRLSPCIEVLPRVKDKFILPRNEIIALQQGAFTTAIGVRNGTGNRIALPDAKKIEWPGVARRTGISSRVTGKTGRMTGMTTTTTTMRITTAKRARSAQLTAG